MQSILLENISVNNTQKKINEKSIYYSVKNKIHFAAADLRKGADSVLNFLLDMTFFKGHSKVSLEFLALYSRTSKRTVQRLIKELQRRLILTVKDSWETKTRKRCNEYRINIPVLFAIASDNHDELKMFMNHRNAEYKLRNATARPMIEPTQVIDSPLPEIIIPEQATMQEQLTSLLAQLTQNIPQCEKRQIGHERIDNNKFREKTEFKGLNFSTVFT